MLTRSTLLILFTLLLIVNPRAEAEKLQNILQGRGVIQTPDPTNKDLEFFYYLPRHSQKERMPVLVCIPGLDGSGAPFVSGGWAEFAEREGFVIISPSFRFNMEDWSKQRSYQFPSVWSGEALLKMIDEVAKKANILKEELYLFGHSAGAQFAHRFALWRPKICIAVAFHAPGGITLPERWIPTRFLVTVGEDDIVDRRKKARLFTERCKDLGISVVFKEYPKIGHSLTEDQIRRSLDFFVGIKKQRRYRGGS